MGTKLSEKWKWKNNSAGQVATCERKNSMGRVDFPTHPIHAVLKHYHNDKHLSAFYLQDGGEKRLASI